MRNAMVLLVVVFISVTSVRCGENIAQATVSCQTAVAVEGPSGKLKMNDFQAVGSHNSYKQASPQTELNLLRPSAPEWALSLDYHHLPLSEQLDLGMRQLELDIFYDPEGGRYSDPLLPRIAADATTAAEFDGTNLEQPGYKVLHVQDIDPRSSCPTFVACLSVIKRWSVNNPYHVPVLILVNAKDGKVNFPGAVEALPYDAKAFEALDEEIFTVFGRDQLIVPDDVRGNWITLREAVLDRGWPLLGQARGKVWFALDEEPEKVQVYLRGNQSLQGLPMFVNSISFEADHAAYFTINNPLGESGAKISLESATTSPL